MISKFTKYGFSGLRKILLSVLLLCLGAIIVSCYFLYKQNQTVNYFMSENNQNYKILPTNIPILQVDQVKQWTTSAIAVIFSFNFINYSQEITKQYFTKVGWDSFNQAMQNNGLLNDVLNKNLILSTNVCGLPVLANREQDPRAFYLASKWKFFIPIIINIQGASGVTRNPVYIIEADVRFLVDDEISNEYSKTGESLILGIDSIKMKSANFTNYCRIPF